MHAISAVFVALAVLFSGGGTAVDQDDDKRGPGFVGTTSSHTDVPPGTLDDA